ncbi:hypothetical protein DPMN_076263 [Dreissena polymorpha]|uniref:Uncharacterized protein n=1 Tax=Dreissena polymorpha TaxID=45954 RepID=A0A9D4BFL9_DREPO|nr:hypothetical protein DPMN_076263 [Dreissena polymorpha]
MVGNTVSRHGYSNSASGPRLTTSCLKYFKCNCGVWLFDDIENSTHQHQTLTSDGRSTEEATQQERQERQMNENMLGFQCRDTDMIYGSVETLCTATLL